MASIQGATKGYDSEGMYNFFMSLKQPDGSFLVARHSEVDVRCAPFLLLLSLILKFM